MSPPPAAAAPGPELRDIHLPPAPGWWPPAPGWWLLALAAAALLAWLFFHLYKRARRRRYRREIMLELDRCVGAARGDPGALATALSQFLRRLSRRAEPAASVLSGEPWLQHLDRCAASEEFSRGIGRVLIARGRDAADVALTNTFGPNTLKSFKVWTEEKPDA